MASAASAWCSSAFNAGLVSLMRCTFASESERNPSSVKSVTYSCSMTRCCEPSPMDSVFFSTPSNVPAMGLGAVTSTGSPDLCQNLPQGGVAVEIDAEAAERLGYGIVRAVGDGRDSAATEVLRDQTLQHVVDLIRMHTEV